MATLTPYALEALGFQRIDAQHPISAKFWLLHISQLQGFKLNDEAPTSQAALPDLALPCTVVLGNSLNSIANSVLTDNFSDDEGAWCNEHKAQPPFIVTIIGPTPVEKAEEGWWKEHEGEGLITYESFTGIKEELRQLEESVTPRIYAALTIQYANKNHPVKLKPVTTVITGYTAGGKTIHDFRVEVSATGAVSSAIATSELNELTTEALLYSAKLEMRVARFLYSGEIEEDQLNRFLHYFVALEIATHRAFKQTDETSTTILSHSLPSSIQEQGTALLHRQHAELKSLVDRFVWCAVTVWPHVADHHVTEFKRLKKIRDDVAHGNVAVVARADADAARRLVLHVLRAQDGVGNAA